MQVGQPCRRLLPAVAEPAGEVVYAPGIALPRAATTVANATIGGRGTPMAQSIVSWVDERLDNAPMGPIHRRVLALITAGYFFDVIDFIISRFPGARHGAHPFCDTGRDRHRWQRHLSRVVFWCDRPGRVHRPFRPQGGVPVRHSAIQRGDDRGGLVADGRMAGIRALHHRDRARRRAAFVFFLRRRIFAQADPRPGHRLYAVRRRRLRVAAGNPAGARPAGHDRLARECGS